jgi:peptide deformylase
VHLRITHYGETVLRTTGTAVTHFNAALRQLADNMVETMDMAEGIGLAAQQIDLALQLCVVDVSVFDDEMLDYRLDGKRPPIDLIMPLALANPQVEITDPTPWTEEEGCLSFPGIRGAVPRPSAIRVKYQDLRGAHHVLEAAGWFARVILHEVDHLNGILFIDRMDPAVRKELEPKINRLQRATLKSPL